MTEHSGEEAAGVSAAPPVPLRRGRGLTLKQAIATLVVALVVGLAGAAAELLLDLEHLREDVRRDTEVTLSTVGGSAVEAAYQLSPSLATQVVDGLMGNVVVARALLRDDFGNTLAESTRDHPQSRPWAQGLFRDLLEYELPLERSQPGGRAEEVGSLIVQLSPSVLAARFEARAVTSLTANVLRALVICAVLVALFHVLVTSPLLRLTRAILRVDPGSPGAAGLPPLRGHAGDELGQLRDALDNLLTASQRSLDERDRAQAALQALTRDLERRVEDRTQALAEANAQLSHEKEETERAFAGLDQAHKALDQANGRLLESIAYARRIQTSMLPNPESLEDSVAELAFSWEPLEDVGGDYLWLQRIGERSLLAVVDCTGHGVPGAFMALVAASALDQVLTERGDDGSPGDILIALDRSLRTRLRQDRPDAESDDGLEAGICIWDPAKGEVTFAGAGLPLFYTAGGKLLEIRGDRAAVGYASLPAPRGFTEHVIRPEPGAAFYLPTDGLSDQMRHDSAHLLGRQRLRAMLQELQDLPLPQQIDALRQRLSDWRGAEPRRDDVTLLAFRPLSAGEGAGHLGVEEPALVGRRRAEG